MFCYKEIPILCFKLAYSRLLFLIFNNIKNGKGKNAPTCDLKKSKCV